MMYENIIKPLMSEKRFNHSINVAKSAERLAKKYGVDIRKALIAGVLHDITKERTEEEHIKLADRFNLKLNKFDLSSKKLLHAITGSAYIENILGIEDKDILNAVRYHTTAREGMSDLEKLIFVADCISDDRDYKGVDRIRKLAEKSLDEAMMGGLEDSIRNLVDDSKPIHPNTIYAYNEFALKKRRRAKSMTIENISSKICEVLINRKAMNVNMSCLKDVSVLADYFIFATGTSGTHVNALAEEVEFKLKEDGILPKGKEADDSKSWILLDYGDIIVHIFTDETRKLYNIEEIWKETKKKIN